jgi:cytochrome o ubiquinol oxidase operon protein cyoD
MSSPNTIGGPEAYRHDFLGYVTGFVFAAILTVIPFAMVAGGTFPATTVRWVIAILGTIQILVHVRYFLHVDLSAARREELYLMLFSASLVLTMIAGTLWILFNLYARMM